MHEIRRIYVLLARALLITFNISVSLTILYIFNAILGYIYYL